jgi:hypothetical protein
MAHGGSKIDWREHGVKIIRADQLDPNTRLHQAEPPEEVYWVDDIHSPP